MKIVNIEEENLNLLNDLSNFNEIFKKVLTYDNIRSQKRVSPSLSSSLLKVNRM